MSSRVACSSQVRFFTFSVNVTPNDVGGRSREIGTTHWTSPNTGATNENGLTILPSGFRWYNGTFVMLGNECWMWTSTVYSSAPETCWSFYINYNSTTASLSNNNKKYGFTVRCIKDSVGPKSTRINREPIVMFNISEFSEIKMLGYRQTIILWLKRVGIEKQNYRRKSNVKKCVAALIQRSD